MRGPANTKIKLTIMRKGQDKPIDVTIVRDVIRVKSVRSHTESDDVGYIQLLNHPEVKPLLSDEHFSVDGTLIEAWASHKSFRGRVGCRDR